MEFFKTIVALVICLFFFIGIPVQVYQYTNSAVIAVLAFFGVWISVYGLYKYDEDTKKLKTKAFERKFLKSAREVFNTGDTNNENS